MDALSREQLRQLEILVLFSEADNTNGRQEEAYAWTSEQRRARARDAAPFDRARHRGYYRENRERVLERVRSYYADNARRIRALRQTLRLVRRHERWATVRTSPVLTPTQKRRLLKRYGLTPAERRRVYKWRALVRRFHGAVPPSRIRPRHPRPLTSCERYHAARARQTDEERAERRARDRARYLARKEARTCTKCAVPLVDSALMCERCIQANRAAFARAYKKTRGISRT